MLEDNEIRQDENVNDEVRGSCETSICLAN